MRKYYFRRTHVDERLAAELITMSLKLFFFGLALSLACAHQPVDAKPLPQKHEIRLKMGQSKWVKAGRLKVRFVSVVEDSRCPVGVNCIWAGNAKVSVVLQKAGGRQTVVELNTGVEPRVGSASGYEISLTKLTPHPRAETKINPKTYTATFTLRRKV